MIYNSKPVRSHKVIIKAENVSKTFRRGRRRIHSLWGINLNVYSGEFVIVFGPSGCGKSTLLHTLLGLEPPDTGRVYLRGKNLYRLGEDERAGFRREKVGMVFQQSNWIKSLNVIDNVAYPLFLAGQSKEKIFARAGGLLESLGVAKMAVASPTELSGGEQQKVALARALATNPGILVCDEPTGNLDSKSSRELIGLLTTLNQQERKAVVMVTHEPTFLRVANRRVFMKDGKIVKDEHD